MSSSATKFVLTGPHAGKTMDINGHMFEDGEFTFYGSVAQAAVLGNVFSFYGAFPADRLPKAKDQDDDDTGPTDEELAAAEAEKAEAMKAEEVAKVEAAKADEDDFEKALGGSDESDKPNAEASQSGTAEANQEQQTQTKLSLAEAIGALDPENDEHWTSNNLPSLDFLATLTGKKPSRDDVETLADGYTRAKARSAKQ